VCAVAFRHPNQSRVNTLPESLRQQLLDSPETGADFHVVDLTLANGTRVRDVAIVNCSLIAAVRGKPFVWFSSADVVALEMTHRRWGLGCAIIGG
jgi:hypothetical protein